MSTISTERTIAELVLERPARSRTFESLGIDYCCGGKKTLEAVCVKKKLDPQDVVALLVAGDAAAADTPGLDYTALSLTDLIADIVAQHHDYLREELPRLEAMLTKVTRVHGDSEPRLAPMLAAFLGFAQELGTHMMKEERILFPAIARMEATGSAAGNCFGSVAQPIAQMEAEHDDAGDALALLRELSDDFTPPEWACNTYRAMLDGLHELEQNMHLHVHKENNVLFPKAIHLEAALHQPS
jgi:regulator of cell morphogenesis and NO signaling